MENLEKKVELLFIKVCERFIYNGFRVFAVDTHRWCETDGFYEVEFSLQNGIKSMYIHTATGNQTLEDKWSKNNGTCYIADVLEHINDIYCYQMFFEDVVKSEFIEFFNEKLIKEIYQMIDDIENR